jgi:hypothetical protein
MKVRYRSHVAKSNNSRFIFRGAHQIDDLIANICLVGPARIVLLRALQIGDDLFDWLSAVAEKLKIKNERKAPSLGLFLG